MAARVVRSPEAILQLAAGCDVVGVDEGQFLDDSLIDVCEELVERGVRVVIAGLELDYRRSRSARCRGCSRWRTRSRS